VDLFSVPQDVALDSPSLLEWAVVD